MVDYVRPYRDTLEALGERARQLRLLRQLSQLDLSTRAGVGVMTVRRFESTGIASTENMLRIATALDAGAALEALFAPPPFASLDELEQRPVTANRRRAPRKK